MPPIPIKKVSLWHHSRLSELKLLPCQCLTLCLLSFIVIHLFRLKCRALANYFVGSSPLFAGFQMNFTWDAMGLDPFETAFLEERMAGLEVG